MQKHHYRFAMIIAVGATLALIWLSLGVGIIGADGDPANRMYMAVLGIGVLGSAIARLKARGMVLVLLAMAAAQTIITAIALVRGLGQPWSGPAELIILNGFFIAMFATSAWLFRRAAGTLSEWARA